MKAINNYHNLSIIRRHGILEEFTMLWEKGSSQYGAGVEENVLFKEKTRFY